MIPCCINIYECDGDTCKEKNKKWRAPLWHFIICCFREASCVITASMSTNVSSLWVSSCLGTGVCETRMMMMMMELLLGLWYCIESGTRIEKNRTLTLLCDWVGLQDNCVFPLLIWWQIELVWIVIHQYIIQTD